MRYLGKTLLLYLFVAGAAYSPSHAQSDLIVNGTFNADIDGWALDPSGTGAVEWTSADGLPPGALKMTGGDQAVMPLDCFHFIPGTIFFEVDAFMSVETDLVIGCALNFFMYTEQDDCTGPSATFPSNGQSSITPAASMRNEWEHLVMEVPIPNNPADTGVLSFRPVMVKFTDPNNDDACLFDNASLRIIPRGVIEIPTTSPTGLAVLGVLLAATAFVILRRHP